MRAPTDHFVRAHPRSPHLWYQRDVPKDVRPVIGKSRWKKSLETASRAVAVRKARQLAEQHDRLIEEARQGRIDPLSRLTTEERAPVDNAGGLDAFRAWLNERAMEAHASASLVDIWQALAAEKGRPDEAADPDWAAAEIAGLNAKRAAIERHLGQNAGILAKLGLTPERLADKHPALASAVASGLPQQGITLSGVLRKWEEAKQPGAPEQYRYPVKLFEDMHGALPLADISEEHVRQFRDILRTVPTASGGKLAELDLHAMIARADADDLPRLGQATAAKYFRSIKTILKFAKSDGYVTRNPAEGLDFHFLPEKFSARRTRKRRSLSPAELVLLLDCADRHWRYKKENRWFLWLMIWTGARPEELAQLAPADIKRIGGHLCLDLHDRGDNKLKSSAALRLVPVHPRLVEYGFEEFVATRADRPLIFSTLKADGRGRVYSRMGSRISRLIRNRAKIIDPRVVPYSIRHAFKDALRLVEAPEEVAERIMGHRAPQFESSRRTESNRLVPRGYGNADQVVRLAKWMAKVDPLEMSRDVTETSLPPE